MHNKMPSTNPTKLSKINFQASETAVVPFARGHHVKGSCDLRQQQFLFFFGNISADRLRRLSDCPGQGSENHPDFGSGRKAFFKLLLK